MKKSEYRSWLGLAFIYLFCLNITLILAGLITASLWFIFAAIVLATLQVFFHIKFRPAEQSIQPNTFQSKIKALANYLNFSSGYYLLMYRSGDTSLSRKQREMIIKRSNNIRQAKNSYTGDTSDFLPEMNKKEPVEIADRNLQVTIGTEQCGKPYNLSVFNIGELDQQKIGGAATLALSEGAKIGGFAVNTGKHGISAELIRGGGDLIWQINYPKNQKAKNFNEVYFKVNAPRLYIKMIEVDIDNETALSLEKEPAANAMLVFIKKLRQLSGGKPIGIKISNAGENLLISLCKSMQTTGVYIDFITVQNVKIGQNELRDFLKSLEWAGNLISKYSFNTKIIASGTIISEYDILRAITYGAHACCSTNGMITAANSGLWLKKSDPVAQRVGVANFQRNTVEATVKLMELCRLESLSQAKVSRSYKDPGSNRDLNYKKSNFLKASFCR